MTRKLILMRHAKSSWASGGLRDHDRPLNGRGYASAEAMGDWLREGGHVPDQVLCSSAKRTCETFDGLGCHTKADYIGALYHATPDQMIDVLRRATGGVVLMLGHNPGIAWMAEQIVEIPPQHDRFEDYPTCATLVVEFDINAWPDLKPGTGRVVDFAIPREEMD